VSCVGATCEAVGGGDSRGYGVQFPVALSVIDGRAGPVLALSGPYDTGAALTSVTCSSTTACVAGGGQGNTAHEVAIIAGVAPVGPFSPVPPADVCIGVEYQPPVAGAASDFKRGVGQTAVVGKWVDERRGCSVSLGWRQGRR
jgi:hypothetical protein